MNNIVYFDNAATTFPKPEEVYKYMDEMYRKYGFNIDRGEYSNSIQVIDETRRLLCDLFNAGTDYETIFTSSATEALNVLLQGINWSCINNVYVTHFEHNAVSRTLNHLNDKYSFNIHFLELDRNTLEYDFQEIRNRFIVNKPDLVIMSHASNSFGYITPIEKISSISKEFESLVYIDAAQTAGLLDIDFKVIDCDALVFAGHKTLYGPFGIAGIIKKKQLVLKPLLFGGTGVDSSSLLMPDDSPRRFEAGSQNILSIFGLYRALEWIKEIGRDHIYNHEMEIKSNLIDMLKQFDNIRIFEHPNANMQIGVISTVFDHYSPDEVSKLLSNNNIAARSGLHCSPNSHKFMGTFPSGTVRYSVSYFTDVKDIEILERFLFEL